MKNCKQVVGLLSVCALVSERVGTNKLTSSGFNEKYRCLKVQSIIDHYQVESRTQYTIYIHGPRVE